MQRSRRIRSAEKHQSFISRWRPGRHYRLERGWQVDAAENDRRHLSAAQGGSACQGKISPLIELGTGFDFELSGRENIYLTAPCWAAPTNNA